MALVTHGDGKKIRIQPAIAIFLIIMGVVFLADAQSMAYIIASMTMVVVGFVWYYIATHYREWFHHH